MFEKVKALATALASRVMSAVAIKAGTGAVYNDVTRAVVLTPVHADGHPTWRTKDDSGTARDVVCRVYAAADKSGKVTVVIGGHAWPTKGRREWATSPPLDAAQAEQVITATLVRLMLGRYDGGLAAHVPQALQVKAGYVQRPDTIGGKRTAAVVNVDVDADVALLAPPADITPTATVDRPAVETPTAELPAHTQAVIAAERDPQRIAANNARDKALARKANGLS